MRVRILLNLILGASLSLVLNDGANAGAPLFSSIPVAKPAETVIENSISSIIKIKPVRKPDLIDSLVAEDVVVTADRVVQIKPVRKPTTLQMVMGKRPKSAAQQCNNKALIGEPIDDIPGKLKGCGVSSPVRLTAVHGVQLSRGAIMDCATANAFASWTEKSVLKEFQRKKRDVVTMEVMASYQCRTRNNKKGAKISEHGKGRAVDIGSFVLDSGDRVSVFVDWNSRKWGKTMKAIHKGACSAFKTVLGPNADVYHKDHFHMDFARRNSSYCR